MNTPATDYPARHFDRDKINVLLYLETRLVDHVGRVDTRRMNGADEAAIEQMVEVGLITFGRICSADVNETGSHAVTFTEEAWRYAHGFRKARADKAAAGRTYRTTAEKQKAAYGG